MNKETFDIVLDKIINENEVYENQGGLEYEIEKSELQKEQLEQINETKNEKEESLFQDDNEFLEKIENMSLTKGWNDKNERLIISIGENAASYKWMHDKAAAMYKFINKMLSIILIVFSTGLSAETFIPSGDNNNLILDIFRRIFTYVVTLISVSQNFLKYEKLAEHHLTYSNNFSELYHDIQHQMCTYRKDRNIASKYISFILKRYDSLTVSGPSIPDYTIKQFKNTFKNSDISIPDIADRIQKIDIITEPALSVLGNSKNVSLNDNLSKNVLLNYSEPEDNDKISIMLSDENTEKNLGRYGICNLKQIHNAFQIQGDISDQDIIEMKELRKKHADKKLDFEYSRFIRQ